MPQNTPMKRQFTTIDGRTVMSNLPQHWGGNDWAITGVDNPLPVGNYVQTESGVWIPQKGSDDGAADVRLTGSITKQTIIDNRDIPTNSSTSGILNLMQVNHPVRRIVFSTAATQREVEKCGLTISLMEESGGLSASSTFENFDGIGASRFPWVFETKLIAPRLNFHIYNNSNSTDILGLTVKAWVFA